MALRAIVMVSLVALLVAVASCGGDGGAAASGVKQITITGTDFKFDPATITVDQGQPVQITLVNKGAVAHNFTIPELNVSMPDVAPGQSGKVQFTPDKAGIFKYDCSIAGHLEAGMVGEITVK